jgi:hypothetical protein
MYLSFLPPLSSISLRPPVDAPEEVLSGRHDMLNRMFMLELLAFALYLVPIWRWKKLHPHDIALYGRTLLEKGIVCARFLQPGDLGSHPFIWRRS